MILTDNGSEFSNPVRIEYGPDGETIERTKVFYCNSSSPFQKAEIEVGHEFIRRIVPKGKSFDKLEQEDIDKMMNHINSYRRKELNGKVHRDTHLQSGKVALHSSKEKWYESE